MPERKSFFRNRLERVVTLAELADLIYPDPKAMKASHLVTDLIGRIDGNTLTAEDISNLNQHQVDYQFMQQHENSPSSSRSPQDKEKRILEESKVIGMIADQTGVSTERINQATQFWLSTTSF